VENRSKIAKEQVELASKLTQLIEAKKETIYSLAKKINYSTRTTLRKMINCEVSMGLCTWSKLNEIVESYEKQK
jgi:hypothetical protein